MTLNSTSSHSSRSQVRTAGAMVGPELYSPFIFDSQSAFKGSSDLQPVESNSTVDPSQCLHLKQKFMGSGTSKLCARHIALDGCKASVRGRRPIQASGFHLGVSLGAPLAYEWRLGMSPMTPAQQAQNESANRSEEVFSNPENSTEEHHCDTEPIAVMNSDMSFAEMLGFT
jgi:hypothetical protein